MKGPISLMVLALLIIGGSIAYKYVGQQPAEQPTAVASAPQPAAEAAKPLPQREIFAYVPQDAIMFFGGLEAVALKDMLDVFLVDDHFIKQVNWDEVGAQANADANAPPGARFMGGLQLQYLKSLRDTAQTTSVLGVGEKLDSVMYTVGMIPVFRVKLEDPAAFTAFLDAAEQTAQVIGEKRSIDSISYRAFSLDKPDAEKKSNADIVAAIVDGYGIFTISTPLDRESNLRLALGMEKPATSLSVASVEQVRKAYNFHPSFIGYVDHREIMRGLTQENGNAFGRMLDSIREAAGASRAGQMDADAQAGTEASQADEGGDGLAAIRTPACQQELMAIAETWPRSVFGYTKFETKARPVQLNFLATIESNDAETLDQLRKLRGFLPATLREDGNRPLFGLGIGLNASALAPVMDSITQNFMQKSYQCDPLKNMQQSFVQSGSAMAVGMFSGMFSAVKGVSAIVFDVQGQVDPSNPASGIQGIDAFIAITSDNPLAVLNAAKSMAPPLAEVEVPLDGSPGILPFPMPGGAQAKIAMTGRHIVLYSGPKATALSSQISGELLESHGLLALSMDYGRQMGLLNAAMAENPGFQEPQREVLKSIEKSGVQFVQLVDITPKGIAWETRMRMN